MSKSIYSLVLTDEVISQIERIAYRKGMSRSALIDSILAEAVSFTTPEQRIREILSEFQTSLPMEIFVPSGSGSTFLSVRSALDYKYSPSLRFSVDLLREYGDDGYIGNLSIWLRSRSETVNIMLSDFFVLWNKIEQYYNQRTVFRSDREKNIRELRLPIPVQPEISSEKVGRFLSEYVSMLNKAVGFYFNTNADKNICISMFSTELENFYKGRQFFL